MNERPTNHAPSGSFVAVDIGNSRMKIGLFERKADEIAESNRATRNTPLPEPTRVAAIEIDNQTGNFDLDHLIAWCGENAGDDSPWFVASVHRGAADRLTAAIAGRCKQSDTDGAVRRLTYRDVPLPIQLDEPQRVGIDRLLGALAADRLRTKGRAAIVIDLGTAITVDLLTADGAFAGGAILPGIALSARALAEGTDALPQLPIDFLEKPPAPLGKSTATAIESGLYWGAIGAIRELIERLSAGLSERPEIFLTGGASAHVAELLGPDQPARHVPHLVLAGIAFVADADR